MTNLTVRVNDLEKNMVDALTEYLYATGRIKSNTYSDTVRYALFNILTPIVLKEIEERRFVKEEGG